jgi:hypothetical protein
MPVVVLNGDDVAAVADQLQDCAGCAVEGMAKAGAA